MVQLEAGKILKNWMMMNKKLLYVGVLLLSHTTFFDCNGVKLPKVGLHSHNKKSGRYSDKTGFIGYQHGNIIYIEIPEKEEKEIIPLPPSLDVRTKSRKFDAEQCNPIKLGAYLLYEDPEYKIISSELIGDMSLKEAKKRWFR